MHKVIDPWAELDNAVLSAFADGTPLLDDFHQARAAVHGLVHDGLLEPVQGERVTYRVTEAGFERLGRKTANAKAA